MSDSANPLEDKPSESGEAERSARSGGVDIKSTSGGAVNISGIVVGRDYIAAPAPIVTSLHQLPPPPRDFTGRAAELAELLTKAETDGVTISGLQGLHGMGGVGKTALALVLADRLKDRYPDAQFYLDLQGAHAPAQRPLTVAEALAHVIRAYHPTAQLPEGEAELRGLYRSVLHGQRALLLMDNAADQWQVEPLLPPASCFLLVTSRQHFTLPGLHAKNLDTLPPADARDLLLRIAARIDGQADALAQVCGYLPLALRLAGGVLAERVALTPEAYLRRLEDSRQRLALVDASLSLSFEVLAEVLQRAWCALAVFPGAFDGAAAAAVWAAAAEAAQDRLGELVRYSLVEWDETAARARLHDLARLFADRHLGDAARLDSQRRHAAHYHGVLRRARNLYEQGGDAVLRGLALFDVERPNVEAGQAWVAEHAEADDTAAGLCSDYPDAGAYVLDLRQHPRERIRWLEAALAAARRLKRQDAEGWHVGNLGLAYFSLGEYRRAIEYHEQNLTIARAIGDRRGEGQALGNLGLAYYSLGEYRRAIEYHEQHLTIAREIGDRRGEGAALGNLGLAYYSLGEYRRAIEYHEQHLTIAREIGDRRGEGAALGNLGLAYYSLGEYRRAIEYQEQHLAIAREIGDRLGEGAALGNLGSAYYSLKDYGRARECYGQQRAIAREIGDRFGEASSLWGLAACFDAAKDRRQAIAHAQAALDIFTAIEAPQAQAMRDLLKQWK
jgi:tetratricopeptide (TPR) repeat protein